MARAKVMPPGKRHWILIHEDTVMKLKRLMHEKDSYDSVIRKLIAYYESRGLRGY